MDWWTADTVRAMCRYVDDNERIARHVGCSVAAVANVRRQVPQSESARIAAPKKAVEHAKLGAADAWQRKARDATAKLGQAIIGANSKSQPERRRQVSTLSRQ